jgi:homoserine O-acetyltransferase
MGGMQTWLWGTHYPDFMDLLVPMASTPSAMSGRNWMMRRLIIDAIQNDPTWNQGNYTEQPKSLQFASAFFSIATSGGTKALQRIGPTKDLADAYVNQKLKENTPADANDNLYQWESSADYNPEPDLKKIKARVLIINAEDDERNPVELGRLEKALEVLPNARLFLIPSSDQTSGHGTTSQAKWWSHELQKELSNAPLPKP